MIKLKHYALITGLASAGLASVPAIAADSPHSFTGNVGIYSQYIFRGLNQTDYEPALQGGFDYAHASGFYLGTWASNVSWLRDAGTYNRGGSLEWDFYGGYKASIGDFGFDVGLLQYYYPGGIPAATPSNIKADTLEAYIGVSWKWFSVKYSQSLTNKTFAVKDSSGTNYWDFTATVPLGDTGVTLVGHYGIQTYKGTDDRNTGGLSNDALYSYNDWKIALTYDMGKMGKAFDGVTVGAMYTDTGSATCAYGATTETCTVNGTAVTGVFPKNITKGTGTVWISKSF